MISIHLNSVRFYSFHGLYEEERVLGGDYELDMDVMFEESVNVITDLKESVNYSDLYAIASEQMAIATPLIETVAMRIGAAVYNKFNYLKSVTVTIKKMHPPLIHFQGSVAVSWNKEY